MIQSKVISRSCYAGLKPTVICLIRVNSDSVTSATSVCPLGNSSLGDLSSGVEFVCVGACFPCDFSCYVTGIVAVVY